jgi:hypothetical protein
VAQKLGYDWDTEQARMQAEQAAGETETPGDGKAKILGYHIETGVATRNEARADIGLPPEASAINEQKLRDIKATLGVSEQLVTLGIPRDVAMKATGLDQQIGNVNEPTTADAPIVDLDEANRLKVMFEAAKAAVDAGVPLETFLEKYLAWSKSDINAITQAQEDSPPSPLEQQAREMMNANAAPGQQPPQANPPGQPGQPGPIPPGPRPVGGTPDGGATNQGGGSGGQAGGRR